VAAFVSVDGLYENTKKPRNNVTATREDAVEIAIEEILSMLIEIA
jgi:hypothetical protein